MYPLNTPSYMTPNDFSQKDDAMLSAKNHSFALSGEIMLLVLVILFILFLVTVIFLLCRKRSNYSYTSNSQTSSPDQIAPSPYPWNSNVKLIYAFLSRYCGVWSSKIYIYISWIRFIIFITRFDSQQQQQQQATIISQVGFGDDNVYANLTPTLRD